MSGIWYVYGVVPATAGVEGAPPGLDDASVSLVGEGGLGALVSRLDGLTYAPSVIERHSAEVAWVSPRAVSHDGVLTWASDRGPVVPLAMFTSIFSSEEGVREMLRTRAEDLDRILRQVSEGREYALRVYRVDSELTPALPSLSAEFAALQSAADGASPGQRYLLQRKLEERTKEELKSVGRRVAGEIHDALAAVSIGAVTSPIPRTTVDAPGTMILNGAYLVAVDALPAFQEVLTGIVQEREPHGFRFEFTGPWPPYHFAGAA